MRFRPDHTEIHVLDLDASIAFYSRAFGLRRLREIGSEDGSWRIVFLGCDGSEHRLELTWNRGRELPYDEGGGDIHLAFAVDDMEAARALHEQMGIISVENRSLGVYFVRDPDGFSVEVVSAR